jgi:hypothetical protein
MEVVGMTSLRKRMVHELRLRNLSEVTVRLYIGSVERFARYFGKSPEQLGPELIREFLLHLLYDRKSTSSTARLYRSALRFLYVTTLKRSWFDDDVAHIKDRRKLPTVLRAGEESARASTTGVLGLAVAPLAIRALIAFLPQELQPDLRGGQAVSTPHSASQHAGRAHAPGGSLILSC